MYLLSRSTFKLQNYIREYVKVVGSLDVEVEYKNQRKKLPLTIVQRNGPIFLGRSWLQSLQLD